MTSPQLLREASQTAQPIPANYVPYNEPEFWDAMGDPFPPRVYPPRPVASGRGLIVGILIFIYCVGSATYMYLTW